MGAANHVVAPQHVVAMAAVATKRVSAAPDSTVQSARCLRHARRVRCSMRWGHVVRVACGMLKGHAVLVACSMAVATVTDRQLK